MAGFFLFGSPSIPSFTAQWRPLSLGAGGQITAIYNYLEYGDATTLIRTDTYGCYLYVTSGTVTVGGQTYNAPAWKQLLTASGLPASLKTNAAATDISFDGGVAEIVMAPSDPNTLYMIWQGFFWVSVDRGVNWVKTSQTATNSPNNNNSKERSPYIAVDPNDKDIVFIGTPAGTFRTANGTAGAAGGTSTATFAAITGMGTVGTFGNVFAFEKGSSTHIITQTNGTGYYESTASGASGTWSFITGSPSTGSQIRADKWGQFWFVTNSNQNVYKYASGTLTTIATGADVRSVCLNPSSSSVGTNQVITTNYYGQPNINNANGTGAWSEATRTDNQTFSASAPQPLWLNVANQGVGQPLLNGWSCAMDNSGNLQFAGGLGVWRTAAPVVTNGTAWAADTLGVEQLVSVKIICPQGQAPIGAVWDKGFFLIENPDEFPAIYYNNSTSVSSIMGGWGIDYASNDPTFICGWEDSNITSSYSPATSTNGGNSWTIWSNLPDATGPTGAGALACLTNQKWVVITNLNQGIQYTTSGATTAFAYATIAGSPTNWLTATGVGQPLAADRVAANTYCAVTTTPTFYVSTDSGVNFTATPATVDGAPNAFALKSVPGQSGHYFYTAGQQSGSAGSHPANTHLWKSPDTCASFSSVNANLREPVVFGFGAPPPSGGSYAVTIYTIAWFNGVYGLWQSIDGGTNWTAINVPASQTPYPLDHIDFPYDICGDLDVYGRIYVGYVGSGMTYIDTADALPWACISSPNPNQSVTGTITITAQHSGAVPIASLQFKVDGNVIATISGNSSTYSTSWNTGSVAAGAHTLTVSATGANGTSSKSIPITTT